MKFQGGYTEARLPPASFIAVPAPQTALSHRTGLRRGAGGHPGLPNTEEVGTKEQRASDTPRGLSMAYHPLLVFCLNNQKGRLSSEGREGSHLPGYTISGDPTPSQYTEVRDQWMVETHTQEQGCGWWNPHIQHPVSCFGAPRWTQESHSCFSFSCQVWTHFSHSTRTPYFCLFSRQWGLLGEMRGWDRSIPAFIPAYLLILPY